MDCKADMGIIVKWLSVFGAMQMVQCKWSNGENNRLGSGLGLGIGLRLGSGFDYFRHCAICIVPNTESLVKFVCCVSVAAVEYKDR